MNEITILLVVISSVVLTKFVQDYFLRSKKIDSINKRSSHTVTATRTGGITVYILLVGISFFYYFQNIEPYNFSILIPISILFFVGVYDDFYEADFKLKFFIQAIVAKIIIDQGYIISNFYGVFGLEEIPWFAAQVFTAFVFLIIVNAINFIDGIDGLAVTICIKFLILAGCIMPQVASKTLSLTVIVTLIPLYYFNFRKQNKVFLGDAGSLLIGTLIAIYLFDFLQTDFESSFYSADKKPYLAIVLVLYPLVDLLRVFLIRLYNGKSPFDADKNHLHHLFLQKFPKHHITVIAIVLIEFLIQLALFLSLTI